MLGQESNVENLGKSFLSVLCNNIMLSILVKIASMRRF